MTTQSIDAYYWQQLALIWAEYLDGRKRKAFNAMSMTKRDAMIKELQLDRDSARPAATYL